MLLGLNTWLGKLPRTSCLGCRGAAAIPATQRSAWSTKRCLLLLPPQSQHGEGLGDKFSVDYIFQAAEKAAGGTPATGVDEDKWLAAFLQARYNLLASWDSTSQASVNRIKIYQELLKLGGCRGVCWRSEGYNAGRRCVHLCTLSCSGPQMSLLLLLLLLTLPSCPHPPSQQQATPTWTAPSTSI